MMLKKKNKKFYAIFGFITDSKEMEYFYIKYDAKLFDNFSKQVIFNKQHFNIPIEYLKQIEDFYYELDV